MWYSDLFRRHLLDMHIEDWDEVFLSEFSPETYVENLKKARINYAMIYLQSHAGLCYWPTESGVMHRAFVKDPTVIRKTVDLCREAGIRVCGYYSLIYNTREHDRHPEWRMIADNGRSRRENNTSDDSLAFASVKSGRYGLCCPSNPDYRQFVLTQIDEMLAYFELDALFFDMPFWPHTCYCEHCRAAFGKPIPVDVTDEVHQFKFTQMGAFIRAVTDRVKQHCPDMPVEHNFAQSIAGAICGCGEEVLDCCDYVGGDLYGGIYNHAFACKFFRAVSKNQPFEQMLSRCKPALRMHTLSKTDHELKTEVAITLAHHGATLMIDAIDPIGTMDGRVYERFGRVFDWQIPYEKHLHGRPLADVGIYYGMRSRRLGDNYNARECCANLGKTLIGKHVLHDVTGVFGSLDYPLILAPSLSSLEDKSRLIEYVEKGGCLYISGCDDAAFVEKLTGNHAQGVRNVNQVYMAPVANFGEFTPEYPMPFDIKCVPLVRAGASRVLATLTFPYTEADEVRFASIHSDPPGRKTDYAALTVSSYGKGKVLWSALPIEGVAYDEYRDIFWNLCTDMCAIEPTVKTDAPDGVEITAFAQENGWQVNAVRIEGQPSSCTVWLKTDQPCRVVHLPDGRAVESEYQDGYTVWHTDKIEYLETYQIGE